MSSAVASAPAWTLPRIPAMRARTAPEAPRAVTGPVFISDVVTVRGGEPLLLLLWRQWDAAREARQDAAEPPHVG